MKSKIDAIIKKYAKFFEFVRFCMVGVMNTLVYYTVYFVLLQLGVHYIAAATTGTIVGITNSFIWNKLFVFKAKKRVTTGEVVKFIVVYGVQYTANILIIYTCTTHLNLSAEIAGLVGVVICPFISYVGLRFWGFRKPVEDGEAI